MDEDFDFDDDRDDGYDSEADSYSDSSEDSEDTNGNDWNYEYDNYQDGNVEVMSVEATRESVDDRNDERDYERGDFNNSIDNPNQETIPEGITDSNEYKVGKGIYDSVNVAVGIASKAMEYERKNGYPVQNFAKPLEKIFQTADLALYGFEYYDKMFVQDNPRAAFALSFNTGIGLALVGMPGGFLLAPGGMLLSESYDWGGTAYDFLNEVYSNQTPSELILF